MAGKTKSMSQIKHLLLLKKQNVSNRKAATQVGMDKETVNNYVRKALADPLGIDGLLKLDDPVLEHRLKGGEKVFLDYTGDTLGYVDRETGEIIKTQTFVASLPASDYGYILFVPSQRTEDFVYAISQYFKHIGGVPKILVPDNLKAAIVKSDRYEPSVNRILEDMANHYGCFIQPARPLHPKDKSLVEDHVKLMPSLTESCTRLYVLISKEIVCGRKKRQKRVMLQKND